jgi:hypothetical protein
LLDSQFPWLSKKEPQNASSTAANCLRPDFDSPSPAAAVDTPLTTLLVSLAAL